MKNLLLAVFLEVGIVSERCAAQTSNDFSEALKHAQYVLIAVNNEPTNSKHLKVLAYFGFDSMEDAKAEASANQLMSSSYRTDPKKPVLYIAKAHGAFFASLIGEALVIPTKSESFFSIGFSELPAYVKSVHNPNLTGAFVRKDWINFIPKAESLTKEQALKQGEIENQRLLDEIRRLEKENESQPHFQLIPFKPLDKESK